MSSPSSPSFAPIAPEEREIIAEAIRRVGHAVQLGCVHQRADQKIVSYTIGLSERGLPEFFISTKSDRTGMWMVNFLTEFFPKITTPDMDCVEFKVFQGDLAGMMRRVPRAKATREVLTKAGSYFGREVDAMQFVLQDTRRRYPWEPDADPAWTALQCVVVDWRESPPEKVAQIIE